MHSFTIMWRYALFCVAAVSLSAIISFWETKNNHHWGICTSSAASWVSQQFMFCNLRPFLWVWSSSPHKTGYCALRWWLISLMCCVITLHCTIDILRAGETGTGSWCARGDAARKFLFSNWMNIKVFSTPRNRSTEMSVTTFCQTVWWSNLFKHRSCMLKRRPEKSLQNTFVLTSD